MPVGISSGQTVAAEVKHALVTVSQQLMAPGDGGHAEAHSLSLVHEDGHTPSLGAASVPGCAVPASIGAPVPVSLVTVEAPLSVEPVAPVSATGGVTPVSTKVLATSGA